MIDGPISTPTARPLSPTACFYFCVFQVCIGERSGFLEVRRRETNTSGCCVVVVVVFLSRYLCMCVPTLYKYRCENKDEYAHKYAHEYQHNKTKTKADSRANTNLITQPREAARKLR